MRLNELRIKRVDDWRSSSKSTNDYAGSIELEGENHKITLKVNHDLVLKIIDLCADSVVEAAKETAEIMKAEIIDGTRLLKGE